MNEKKNLLQNPLIVALGALLCCALWGSATPAIKIGKSLLIEDNVESTILFAGIRFFAAGIITVLIYSIARRKLLYPKLKNMPKVLTVSTFQTVIQYIFFYVGLSLTTGVKGTVLSGSSAFFIVILAALVFKTENLTFKKVLACLVGFAGMLLVNLNGLDFNMGWGELFVIISTISYAFSSMFMKKFSAYEDPVVISGYQFIIGGAFMIIAGLIFGGKISFGDTTGVVILVYLSFLSAVAYAVWGVLLKYNPASKVSIYNFTTPVFGSILSYIFLVGERDNINLVNLFVSLIVVSLGILLLNLNVNNDYRMSKRRARLFGADKSA
jgi:drug/metabolite transporter (DMT)-like permease